MRGGNSGSSVLGHSKEDRACCEYISCKGKGISFPMLRKRTPGHGEQCGDCGGRGDISGMNGKKKILK